MHIQVEIFVGSFGSYSKIERHFKHFSYFFVIYDSDFDNTISMCAIFKYGVLLSFSEQTRSLGEI